MQMEALFPLPLADAGAGATVLEQQSRNSGSPQSKGTTAESEKVNDKTRGFSSHAALSSMSWELLHAARQNCRAERDVIHRAIMGGLLCGGSEIFIKQQPGWFPRCLPVNRSPIKYK